GGRERMWYKRLRGDGRSLTLHQSGRDVVLRVLDALLVRRLVGLDHRMIDRHGCPGIFLDQGAADYHRVIDREDAGLFVIARAFGHRVREHRFDIGMLAQIDRGTIDYVHLIAEIEAGRVEFPCYEHRADALLRRDLFQRRALRRLETHGTGVAMFGRALHPPFDLLLLAAEFMDHRAARPQRAGLLEFRHADSLPLVIGGAVYARILSCEGHRMEEVTRGENRQAEPIFIAVRH